MPAPIVPIDGENKWQDLQAIHAVMAYPEDFTLASERFWAPVWMDRVLKLPEGGELAVGKTELLAMLQAPSVSDVLDTSKKRAISGQIAGHVCNQGRLGTATLLIDECDPARRQQDPPRGRPRPRGPCATSFPNELMHQARSALSAVLEDAPGTSVTPYRKGCQRETVGCGRMSPPRSGATDCKHRSIWGGPGTDGAISPPSLSAPPW